MCLLLLLLLIEVLSEVLAPLLPLFNPSSLPWCSHPGY